MKPRLLLHCDADHSNFVLTRQGESWRQRFTDLRAALDYAAANVDQETPLIVFNELGRVIIETVVGPGVPKPVSEAEFWRN